MSFLGFVVFSFGFWLTKQLQNQSSRQQDFGSMAPQPASTPQIGTTSASSPINRNQLDRQGQNLLSQGQQIEASKLVQQQTNWGLKEARDYVNQLTGPQAMGATAGTAKSPSPLPTNLQLKVQQHIADGQKIAAIKLVRQSTGWNLSTAKEYVERLSR